MEKDNKYSYWVFTVSPTDNAGILPDKSLLIKTLGEISEKWIFQEEQATRQHYQGSLKTPYRIRQQTLLEKFSEYLLKETITISRMQGTWEQSVAYCSKSETRLSGPYVSDQSILPYDGQDVNFLKDESKRHPWQKKLLSYLSLRKMSQILRLLMIAKSYGLPISKGVLEKASSLNTFLILIMVLQNFRSGRRINSDRRS